MSITVYHAPRSRSVRVLWLLEEMGLPYEKKTVQFDQAYLSSDDFRAINPAAKIPALKDGELILFESVAIMEYLLAKYGAKGLAPATDDPLYGPYLQWMHFGEAGMGPYVTTVLGHTKLWPEKYRVELMVKWGTKETKRCLDVLAGPLSANDYLLPTGFSAADISVVYMLLLAKFAGLMKDAPQPVIDYFDRCTAREAWKTASAA